MTLLHLDQFTGIDRRRDAALADQKSQIFADNIYITSGNKYQTRPGTCLVARLPEETRGLYPASGVLRTVAPAGYPDIFNQQTPLVFFDFVGDGDRYARDDVEEFINAERFGSSTAAGVSPIGVIRRRSTSRLEVHWFQDRPDAPGDTAVDSFLTIPFQPTGMVIKLASKLWIPDQVNGVVRFSSTQNGPEDWITELDAGSLPALLNSPGDHTITGLGFMQTVVGAADRRSAGLVIFFEDSIQIWAVDPDPLNHFLTSVINGPGTTAYRSIANVQGEPFFFSRFGFSRLRVSGRAGIVEGNDIGAAIKELTDTLNPDDITASTWWMRLGLYLCATRDGTVYAYKFDPFSKVTGWSRWQVPHVITDFAELKGKLYFRTDQHDVYVFDEDSGDDEDVGPVEWVFRSQYHHAQRPGAMKQFNHLMLYQEGTSTYSYLPDPTTPTVTVPGFQTTGVTSPHRQLPISGVSDSLAIELRGSGRWKLDGYALGYDNLGA